MTQPNIKFNHGQSVWTNSQLKAKQFICRSIKILCTYNGYSTDGWGVVTHSSNGGLPYRIFYSEENNPKEDQWTSEELLFETKDDLLKSL